MTEGNKRQSQYLATSCGLLLSVAAGVLTLLFSLSDSWMQARVLATVALYAISITLGEFGNSGRWFPRFSAPKRASRLLVRVIAAIVGGALLFLAVASCFALGSGNWKLTTTGFVFGMYSSSFLLIRSAITGAWLPDWFGGSSANPSAAHE